MEIAIAKNHAPDFEDFWHLYPKRPGANKAQALDQWNKRIKQGDLPEEILNGTRQYRDYCEAMKTEPQFIKQAATFIGPKKHFLCDWQPTSKGNDRKTWADRLTGKGEDDGFTIDA